MSDKLGFLSGDPDEVVEHVETPAVETAPAVETVADPAPEPAAQAPQRGPDGKFLPKGSDPASAPAEPPAAPQTPAPAHATEDGRIPIAAMLDERDKRQALERQLKELQDRDAARQAQQPPAEPLEPAQELERALYAQNLRVSRKFAERQYGADTIATLHDWATKRCDDDPVFNHQMMTSEDPYEAAYQAYNREQIVAKVSPERLAAFEAWEAAQALAQAPVLQTPPSPLAPPPRSLATAPGTGERGGELPVENGPGEAFKATIR